MAALFGQGVTRVRLHRAGIRKESASGEIHSLQTHSRDSERAARLRLRLMHASSTCCVGRLCFQPSSLSTASRDCVLAFFWTEKSFPKLGGEDCWLRTPEEAANADCAYDLLTSLANQATRGEGFRRKGSLSRGHEPRPPRGASLDVQTKMKKMKKATRLTGRPRGPAAKDWGVEATLFGILRKVLHRLDFAKPQNKKETEQGDVTTVRTSPSSDKLQRLLPGIAENHPCPRLRQRRLCRRAPFPGLRLQRPRAPRPASSKSLRASSSNNTCAKALGASEAHHHAKVSPRESVSLRVQMSLCAGGDALFLCAD